MSDDCDGRIDAKRLATPCSLREACVRAALDRGGERCPTCALRELCQSEVRWFVKAPLLH